MISTSQNNMVSCSSDNNNSSRGSRGRSTSAISTGTRKNTIKTSQNNTASCNSNSNNSNNNNILLHSKRGYEKASLSQLITQSTATKRFSEEFMPISLLLSHRKPLYYSSRHVLNSRNLHERNRRLMRTS